MLSGSTGFVRLLHTCGLSRAINSRALSSLATQRCANRCHSTSRTSTSFPSAQHRPTKWGCRLTTSCQVAASSPHAATIQTAEKKQSRKSGGVVALPTTDESVELDRIRHSVSSPPYLVSLCSLCNKHTVLSFSLLRDTTIWYGNACVFIPVLSDVILTLRYSMR